MIYILQPQNHTLETSEESKWEVEIRKGFDPLLLNQRF